MKFEGQALADVVDLLRDTVGVDILVEGLCSSRWASPATTQ